MHQNDFSSVLLTHTTGWVLPLEFTLSPTTIAWASANNTSQSYPYEKAVFLPSSGLLMHPTLCFTQNLCLSLLMLRVLALVPLCPLFHSPLAALCSGRNCSFSRKLYLFSVKWLEQGECAALIPAVWVQNLAQIGSKSQPIKQIIQDISFSLRKRRELSVLCNWCYLITFQILTETLDSFSNVYRLYSWEK